MADAANDGKMDRAAELAAMASLPLEVLDKMLLEAGVDPATVEADFARMQRDMLRRIEDGSLRAPEKFRARVSGWSLIGDMPDGSIAIVDPDCRVGDGDLVAVDIDGKRLIKRLSLDASGRGALLSEGGAFKPIPFDEVSELEIVGRVIGPAPAGPGCDRSARRAPRR